MAKPFLCLVENSSKIINFVTFKINDIYLVICRKRFFSEIFIDTLIKSVLRYNIT